MVTPISKYYLLCQIGGWGFILTVSLLNASLAGYYNHSITKLLFLNFFIGLVTTHLLRNAILKYGLLWLPFRKGLFKISLAVVLACAIAGITRYLGNSILVRSMTRLDFFRPRQLINIVDCGMVIIPWTMIYLLYFYIGHTRKENLERRHLQVRLKEMKKSEDELTVDVDFILNSLGEIRSSIDENPARSRVEITKFSILLRRGYFKS